ncbi:MAG TPA: ABC transporter permease [Bauldia sp.]|nr:ABC transporter permease [Bauldia sp.]
MTVAIPESRIRRISLANRIVERPEVGAAIGLLALWVAFALIGGDSGFLSGRGIASYLNIAAQVGIVSTTVTLLLIAGEFDLSIGSIVGFCGMIIALGTTQAGWPLWLALLASLAFALAYGFGVGILVVRFGLPSFIITLGGLFLLRGATIGFSRTIAQQPYIGGVKKAIGDDPLQFWFAGSFQDSVDVGFLWWIGLVIVAAVILTKTRFGNWIYAAGGSASAARASGVPVARVKIILFMAVAASGTLLAAVQVLSLGSADSFRGQGKEFEAAITAVIGGTSLSGGTGSIIGTAIGALTLGVVRQGLFFAGVDYDWYQAILGLMLLVAVLINHYARRNVHKD